MVLESDNGLYIWTQQTPLQITDMTVAIHIMPIYENLVHTLTTTVVHNSTSLIRIFTRKNKLADNKILELEKRINDLENK